MLIYSTGSTVTFESICFWCGSPDICINPEIQQLQEDFAIVRPICDVCFGKGLKPSTRNAKKLKRQRVA